MIETRVAGFTPRLFTPPSTAVVHEPRADALAYVMAPRDLGRDEIDAVLMEARTCRITRHTDDGRPYTRRVHFAFDGESIIVPAGAIRGLMTAGGEVPVLCDVSHVIGLSCWRYVWLSGHATPLQFTGGAAERAAWRLGVAQLQRVNGELSKTDVLAMENYAIARIDVVERTGKQQAIEAVVLHDRLRQIPVD